jgi:4-hydroxybenzoate polyprenyltransferase
MMQETIKQLTIVSRAEFLLPNLGSLIMGVSWGINPPFNLTELVILIVLSFTVINLSSAIGAQVNTLSDYDLDSKDFRKKQLVQALDNLGYNRLKKIVIGEILVTLGLVVVFMWVQTNPLLLLMWIVGITLGILYSAPPVRFKARTWLAPVVLILVLAILPILFAYFTFTLLFNPVFLFALAGLAATVYAVIIPTEIRDYFGDKEMGIETLTVHLGLVKASLLSMILLSLGGSLMGIAFFITFVSGQFPFFSLLVLIIAIMDIIVLRKLTTLYTLSKEYENSHNRHSITQNIRVLNK